MGRKGLFAENRVAAESVEKRLMSTSEAKLAPEVRAPFAVYRRGSRRLKMRNARGFSIGEVEAAGFTVAEVRRVGFYVDERRQSNREANVKTLKDLVKQVSKLEGIHPKPKYAKQAGMRSGPHTGRAHRGMTPAGRKSRGLYKIGLGETHKHKWRA